jgi:hypothetical protein
MGRRGGRFFVFALSGGEWGGMRSACGLSRRLAERPSPVALDPDSWPYLAPLGSGHMENGWVGSDRALGPDPFAVASASVASRCVCVFYGCVWVVCELAWISGVLP